MTAVALALEDRCTCGHSASQHVGSRGRCRAQDSYDLPCECPSFEHDPNADDDSADEADTFEYERRRAEMRYGGTDEE